MALTKVTSGGITDSAITSAKISDGSIINADVSSSAALATSKITGLATSATTDTTDASNITTGTIPTARLSSTLDLSSKTVTLPAASVTAHATTPALDSPSITGTLSLDDGGNVSHTIGNWSDDITYVLTPTNCTLGSINTSGVFVVTHTSGVPSYTIKATTDSLGLDDSALVTKNLTTNLAAPTISSPADNTVSTNVVYTVTSTDSNDDKIILDMGTSSFTLGTVSPGSGTKVGNTVEVTGFTTGNPVITVQFTALGTYAAVKAKSVKIDASYGDSAYSSTDSILIYEQLSAPSLNAPADTNDSTAVTYTISSIDANATKVIFDAQSSNFTYGSVGSGSGSKVGNTVEITGWTGTSVTVTLTYTTAATYSNRAKVTNSANAVYTDSAYSSTDSIVISSSVTWYGDRGIWGGGNGPTVTIEYVTIATPGSATDFGDLTLARQQTGSCSSGSRGIFAGGSYNNTIDYITIASTGNATDFGNRTIAGAGPAGCSDGTRGLFGGGYVSADSNVIDYVTIATTGNAQDFGDLTDGRDNPSACASATRGIWLTGYYVNTADYVTISTTGNAVDFGDMTVARYRAASTSDATRGVCGGGGISGGSVNTIDYITMATTGNGTDFGDLSANRALAAACSDGTYGVWAGGAETGDVNVDTMEYVTIQTTGNTTDFGNLITAKQAPSGLSGD